MTRDHSRNDADCQVIAARKCGHDRTRRFQPGQMRFNGTDAARRARD
jgi:hypothetical protein